MDNNVATSGAVGVQVTTAIASGVRLRSTSNAPIHRHADPSSMAFTGEQWTAIAHLDASI